jgi:hypothetical protein
MGLPADSQTIVALDLEGVLVPEVWIAVAERTGIAELRRTTRDEPDYDTLMRYRLELLDANGLTMPAIADVIGTLAPLPGAVSDHDRSTTTSRVSALNAFVSRKRASAAMRFGVPCGTSVLGKLSDAACSQLIRHGRFGAVRSGKAQAEQFSSALHSLGIRKAATMHPDRPRGSTMFPAKLRHVQAD